MTEITPFARSLQQELMALLRGASLECPVCGEFVLHEGSTVRCPECELIVHGRPGSASLHVALDLQAG